MMTEVEKLRTENRALLEVADAAAKHMDGMLCERTPYRLPRQLQTRGLVYRMPAPRRPRPLVRNQGGEVNQNTTTCWCGKAAVVGFGRNPEWLCQRHYEERLEGIRQVIDAAEEPFPHVYEIDSSHEFYQVVWVDPAGHYRRSHTVPTLAEAQARARRHPDWPYAITRNYHAETIEAVERG